MIKTLAYEMQKKAVFKNVRPGDFVGGTHEFYL
jgi:hypothetical protein